MHILETWKLGITFYLPSDETTYETNPNNLINKPATIGIVVYCMRFYETSPTHPHEPGKQMRICTQVAPFDLVFEYNHAVEGWQALSRPTISRLGEVVHTIGDFMREMSKLLQKEYPR